MKTYKSDKMSEIAAFYILTKIRKNPSVHEQMKGEIRCVFFYTMSYYSAIKMI